uniref:RNA-dependent RNA polymerase n=1 Tax=Shayang Spider Virus 2 TaxID=1608069 RepID=A0A0B5KTU5_9VIRU|nr:RNA-dependent RNA polymerase [Shayang Spider Virus 2]
MDWFERTADLKVENDEEMEVPTINAKKQIELILASKEKAKRKGEVVDETEEELDVSVLTTLKETLTANLTGINAAQVMETLEFFRHNRFRDILLKGIKQPDKIIAKNDSKIRGILRDMYIEKFGNKIRPTWWNQTPDALIMRNGKYFVLEVAVSGSPNIVRRKKIEKYSQMTNDLNIDLIVKVHQDGNEMVDLDGQVVEDEYYMSILKTMDEVNEIIDGQGLRAQYERSRNSVRPMRKRDINIPDVFTELRPSMGGAVKEEELMMEIMRKSEDEQIFKKTTARRIQDGYSKASKKLREECDTNKPKNNSLNFLFSTERFGEGEKESEQVDRFLNMMDRSVNPQLKELASIARLCREEKIKRVTPREARICAPIMRKAKVKGFWEKDEEVKKKVGDRLKDPDLRKHMSWDPMNEDHIKKAMDVTENLTKMDKEYFTKNPILCPNADDASEVMKVGCDFANSILLQAQKTAGIGMCRFASQMGLKTLHSKGNQRYKLECWTGGFSANMFIKLPCEQPRVESSTIPFLSLSICREERNLIDLTDIMYKENIILDGEKVTLYISNPQRLVLRQMEQWINADLEAINLIALHSKPVENFQEDVKLFPIGHVTMFCLNQHLSLSYLLESLKNIGQSSLSDYSRIEEFIEDKLSAALKSPYEVLLWRNSLAWAIKLHSLKPKSRSVIISNDENEQILRSSTINIKFPSLFAIGEMYDLADIFNQISAPFMMRKKNQHDPIQGLTTLYGDVTKLQLDWDNGDKDVKVKDMTTKSKFTYDSRYIKAATNKAISDFYERQSTQIMMNYEDSGTFDSHGLIATNRGSRKPKPDQAGFLVSSTNIEESLEREHKTRVVDVAVEAVDEPPRFEFAQKEQKGKDRAIGITTFPYRCMLKCAEDLAKAHSKVLPNEAMNKGGELKIKIAQSKISQLIKNRIDDIEAGKATLLMLSADNTKHSEHDAVEKYILSWAMHRHLNSRERGLVRMVLEKMKERMIHLPKRIWNHYRKMIDDPFEENKEIAEFWKGGPAKRMPGGWVQGMFNNLSTKIHAEAQLYAIEVIRYALQRDVQMVGDVHSDDSWLALLISIEDGDNAEELHARALNVYYWCMQGAGFRLNLKKTVASVNTMEFLSRFYILGDQVSTYVKSGISIISPLPCRGPGIDMPSGLGKVMQYLRDGGWMCMTYMMCALVSEQINRLYSMGPGQINDPCRNGAAKRTNIPLGHGGFYSGTPLALMMWGPKIHNLGLLYRFERLTQLEKRFLFSALPLYKGDFTNIKDAIGRSIDGGWRGPVNNPNARRSVEKVKTKFKITDIEMAKKIIEDHPVLRYEKPRTHSLLMRYLRAMILDPDFAMGLEKATGIKTWLRIAQSVRGENWRTGNVVYDEKLEKERPEMVTLEKWFIEAYKTRVDPEIIDSFRTCFNNSGGRLMLLQEQTITFQGTSETERVPHSLKVIQPVPGEKAVTAGIGSLLMFRYDNKLYHEDGRINHLNPDWSGQLELLEEVVSALPEGLPVDQEIGVVQSILTQDKTYKIYASLPYYRTQSPTELLRVMYTYSFFPNLLTSVEFTSIPSSSYVSPTFRMHRRSDLRRACGYVIGLHKWFISSNEPEEFLLEKMREIQYKTDDGPMYLEDLIEEGLNSSALTRAMKDDLMVVKAYLENGIETPFTDEEIAQRFTQVQTNILDVEYSQVRLRNGDWEGYGRFSISMEPNLYTALELDGLIRYNRRKEYSGSLINGARIVSNHKNEAAVNIAINIFRNYLGRMSTQDFLHAFGVADCLDGLQLIGEVFHRRTFDENDKAKLIVWEYNPQEQAMIKRSKIINYHIDKNFNLIGTYPDSKRSDKLRKITVRRTWTWLQLPTQGISDWTNDDGEIVMRTYGSLMINFKELEIRKGIHQLAASPSIDFRDLLECVLLRGDYDEIKEGIMKKFTEGISNMRQMTDELKGGQLLMTVSQKREENDDLSDFMAKVQAIKEASPFDVNLYMKNNPVDSIEIEDEEDEPDLKAGTMVVIRYKGGQSLAYSMTLGFRMMFATSLNVYVKEDVVDSWPLLVALWRWIENKELELGDNGWERTEGEEYIFLNYFKTLVTMLECTTSFTYDDAPGKEDYLRAVESSTIVDEISETTKEGKIDKVGGIIERATRERKLLLYSEINMLIRKLQRHYESLRVSYASNNDMFNIFG